MSDSQRPVTAFSYHSRSLQGQKAQAASRQRQASRSSASGWLHEEAEYETSLYDLAGQIRRRYPAKADQQKFLDTVERVLTNRRVER